MKRGQAISVDVMLSLFIFVAVLLTLAWFYTHIQTQVSLDESADDLELAARYAYQSLFQSPGIPSHWDTYDLADTSNQILILGLTDASAQHLIERKITKLSAASAAEYARVKNVIGLRGEDLQFYAEIFVFNATNNSFAFSPTYTFGVNIPTNATNIRNIQGHALFLNGTWMQTNFWVYTDD